MQPAAARGCHGKVAQRQCTMCGKSEVKNGAWEAWEALVPTQATLIRRDKEAGDRVDTI